MSKLSFGIKTAPMHTTYEGIQKVWLEADQFPVIEHAWLFDHFAPIRGALDGPCLEGWTLLAALAAQTNNLRIGMMVTGNTYRNPAVLANMAATVDIVSNGRMDFGIGAGWFEYEHIAYDIPLYKTGERIRRVDEACQMIKMLFTQKTTNFEGRYYTLKGAHCEPKPIQKPHPPFVIGGKGEKLMLRVVAKHADIWNAVGVTPKEYQHKVEVFHEHCEAVGRNPDTIQHSIQQRVFYDNMQRTAEGLQKFIDAGANHLIFSLGYPYPDGIVQQLTEEVIPHVQPK
jgi:F420-dependent oxidoreductase-like protein